jgi:Fur family transcriptional regulator, stress-responsive regulator
MTTPASVEPVPSRVDIAAALRRSGYRVTSQRLVVGEALAAADRHLSADEVRRTVAERLPNVALPTVYAALDALEDAGVIRRVAAARGAALFDAGPAAHHHLVCRRCGAVEDLDADVGIEPALAGARERGFYAEGAEVVVRGLCARCRAASAQGAIGADRGPRPGSRR